MKTKISDAEALALIEGGEGFERDDEGLAAFRDRTAPLRAVVEAQRRLAADEAALRERVTAAHDAGASWTALGEVLGVSRQAARQRFRRAS